MYFESHITIEPVFGERLEQLQKLVAGYGFKVADLLMVKNRQPTAERSNKDTFCTARSTMQRKLIGDMNDCVAALQAEGFAVWRKKIEIAILDERISR